MGMLAVWYHTAITVLFVVVCTLLILVILLQKGRGGGLSGAFGGVGGYSAFGAKTGDVFTWITVGLTALFVLIAVFGNWWYVPSLPASSPVVPVQSTPGEQNAPPESSGQPGGAPVQAPVRPAGG